MQDKKIFFLSGLPRTGSTLLGSILAQNPAIHVTPTSPLYPLLVATNEQLNLLNLQYTFSQEQTGARVYPAIVEAFYCDIKEPVIFDKHRGWPKNIEAIKKQINPNVKIIATVRPIPEIITSYLVLAEKDPANFIDRNLRELGKQLTNENRAQLLWSKYVKASYEPLMEGLLSHKADILLIGYEEIISKPTETMERIYSFCDLAPYEHQWDGIENRCAEAKDEAWGLKNLHTIRRKLEKQSTNPLSYLSSGQVEYFSTFDIDPYGK